MPRFKMQIVGLCAFGCTTGVNGSGKSCWYKTNASRSLNREGASCS